MNYIAICQMQLFEKNRLKIVQEQKKYHLLCLYDWEDLYEQICKL